MTENALQLLLIIPSLGVVIVIGLVQAIGVTDGTLRKRRETQLGELRQAVAGSGDRIELDWLRFKEVPKDRVLALASEHGWRLDGESVQDRAWLLRFARA